MPGVAAGAPANLSGKPLGGAEAAAGGDERQPDPSWGGRGRRGLHRWLPRRRRRRRRRWLRYALCLPLSTSRCVYLSLPFPLPSASVCLRSLCPSLSVRLGFCSTTFLSCRPRRRRCLSLFSCSAPSPRPTRPPVSHSCSVCLVHRRRRRRRRRGLRRRHEHSRSRLPPRCARSLSFSLRLDSLCTVRRRVCL